MTVKKPFIKLCCFIILLILMQFPLLAKNYLYTQSSQQEIGIDLIISSKQKTWKHPSIKIDFQKINQKQPTSNTPLSKDKTPIEVKKPQVVIDDVIVMSFDFPIEAELLSYHPFSINEHKLTFLHSQSPG